MIQAIAKDDFEECEDAIMQGADVSADCGAGMCALHISALRGAIRGSFFFCGGGVDGPLVSAIPPASFLRCLSHQARGPSHHSLSSRQILGQAQHKLLHFAGDEKLQQTKNIELNSA